MVFRQSKKDASAPFFLFAEFKKQLTEMPFPFPWVCGRMEIK